MPPLGMGDLKKLGLNRVNTWVFCCTSFAVSASISRGTGAGVVAYQISAVSSINARIRVTFIRICIWRKAKQQVTIKQSECIKMYM